MIICFQLYYLSRGRPYTSPNETQNKEEISINTIRTKGLFQPQYTTLVSFQQPNAHTQTSTPPRF